MSGRQISSRSYGGFGGSGRHGNSSYVSSSSSAKYSSGSRLNSCVVCCHAIPGEHRRAIFAIGPCDHPICYHCAAKMRVLCEQNECPICRQAVSEVVFSEDSQKKFASFNLLLFDCNSKYNIYFESKSCLDTFNSLLEERCKKCKAPAASIADLQEHLWEKHRLFTCGVCVQNLKIFSEERKYYNSSQLEHHMKSGDPDDRSYQGHPACQLCDQCYLDADELNRHLKREHYYCHLCDFDNTIYYNKYEVLNQHFRDKHFLCEEGNCKNEQFTSVFRTLIDLQAHKAEVHCLTKSEAKSARTLSLDFTFNPSSRGPRNGSYNPTVSASLNEGLNSRGMGRRGRGDRGDRGGGGGNRGGPPTISEDVWMSEDLSSLGAAGPAQLRPEDFPSLDDTGRNNPPIGQENPLSVSFKPPTKANTNQELTSNDNQNSKAPKKPKHKFSTKVKESASFGQKDDEDFPALCLSDSTGGRRTGFNRHVPQSNASSAKSISLADAVKLNSNPSEKTTSQPSDNNTKTSKSTKTSNNSNNNRISNDCTDPNDPTSSQDFSLLQNDFPSLPFKVNGNRKKKKSLNILLASLSNPQPDPPSNYTSVRLVDSFSITKENNGSTSNKNDSDNKSSLEEDMESLLLKEDNFPPLSGESKKKDTKIKSSGPAKSSKASSKPSKQATPSSSSSSATTSTSVVRPPPGYEKRNLNKTKNTSSELTLEAVAQQVIKPITTAPSNSTINNHVNGKKSELSKKTDSINNVNQNELNNSNVSNNSKSSDKADKKPTLSPSNQRKVKRENFEPSSIDPTNSKAAKQSPTNKSTINSRISPSSPTSFSQHPPASIQSERPASSSSRHHQNGTTNSNSNRSSSNYGEPSEYTYIYPDDFDDRNHQLFEKIQSILKDRFSDFDKISRAFFNDEIPSHHYYNKCVDMFRNKLSSVLLELIVLLPDIRKQKHLMAAHDSAVKQRGGAAPIKTGVWEIKTDSELDIVVCPMCGQVLSKKDGAHHIIKHQKIKS